jgi:hypothetical protein
LFFVIVFEAFCILGRMLLRVDTQFAGVSFGVTLNRKKAPLFARCCVPERRKDSLETLIWRDSWGSLQLEVIQFHLTEGQTQNPAMVTNWGKVP